MSKSFNFIIKTGNKTINRKEAIFKIDSQKNAVLISVKPKIKIKEIIISPVFGKNRSKNINFFVIINSRKFPFACFNPPESKGYTINTDSFSIERDTIILKKKIKDITFEISPSNLFELKFINIILTTVKKIHGNKIRKTKTLKLNLPKISQMIQNTKDRKRICSPASLFMILKYYKKNLTLNKIASMVKDRNKNIYGNWLFNTLYANSSGLNSFIARFNSVYEIIPLLKNKIPLAASISFKKGELKNAPLKKTKGHLIVIKGITDKGDIITNDPAADSNKTVERIYNIDEFEKAWIVNKHGTAYIISENTAKLLKALREINESFIFL